MLFEIALNSLFIEWGVTTQTIYTVFDEESESEVKNEK